MCVIDRLPNDVDALLPVPLHRWRQMKRGYNQATEIAKPVSTALRLPIVTNVYRSLATPYQSGLDAHERRTNLKSAFRTKGRLAARHVLIVDDVITTGETGRQIARLVLANGAEKVSMIAIARAIPRAGG
ncbi:MAG: phosphoribosyltransferase family protein [Gammaproteobacteria bacterium]|nr:phosphoribosyltransferase family protein [Gammaproteobacteria bacterium]